MDEAREHLRSDPLDTKLYDLALGDPAGELFDRSGVSDEDMAQVGRLMQALAQLRDADQAMLDAAEAYMKLSSQDMRALHYLIVAKNGGVLVTPSMISAHLKISPASTTKLLNRLEAGGHITRLMHPNDRRAFVIEIAPDTEESAKMTLGKQNSKRVHSALRLSQSDRETVIRFLREMVEDISLSNVDWASAVRKQS
ncbi:MAG: MarR family transcriptional regulator [Scrofimicrobium sp.]